VQAFVIYEESISESRAQLMAITGIISGLQTSRVFGDDNYDTLVTKAALHGSRLLKKSHQATAVLYASHMWWQSDVLGREKGDKVGVCLVVFGLRKCWFPVLPCSWLLSMVMAPDRIQSSTSFSCGFSRHSLIAISSLLVTSSPTCPSTCPLLCITSCADVCPSRPTETANAFLNASRNRSASPRRALTKSRRSSSTSTRSIGTSTTLSKGSRRSRPNM
jgi:hypothetical protein